MTKENSKFEVLCACAERPETEVDISTPDKTYGSEGTTCVFQESTAKSAEVKTSVGIEAQRYKEKKVYKLQILGHPKGGVRRNGQAY